MLQKRWLAVTGAVVVVIALVSGYVALAAEYGSSEDPLVALSYIQNVLDPQISSRIDETIAEKTADFQAGLDTKLSGYGTELDQKIAQFTSQYSDLSKDPDFISKVAAAVSAQAGSAPPATGATGPSVFQVVKVDKGKQLVGNVGCEIVLRIGSAKCLASGSPGLINLSNGEDLPNNGSLAANNLYLVTVDGRGFTATANATVLVMGPYTIK
jgi:hypothetical protein